MTHVKTRLLNMQFGRRDDSPNHTLWCRSHNNPMLWPSTGGVQTIVRWIPLFSLLTYLPSLHTTNRPRQSKFTMLFALNYIKETMYYWGVNSKMQTSHTLCSRPKRYGASSLQRTLGGVVVYTRQACILGYFLQRLCYDPVVTFI